MNRSVVFEDSKNGSSFWEDLFRKFPTMKLYKAAKAATPVSIDFNDFMGMEKGAEAEAEAKKKGKKAPKDQAQTDAGLKFLTDALTNIEDLVSALSLKINGLDEEDNLAELYQSDHPEMSDEERLLAQQQFDERREKKEKLNLLCGNVTVLAGNLQTLLGKAQAGDDEDPLLLTPIDIENIESVITESATMLMMLTQEQEEVAPEEYLATDDGQNMAFEETVRLEDQMAAMDAMVGSVELLNLADELLGEDFQGLEFINVEDFVINESNFLSEDPERRPEMWKEVRMRRILIKEHVDRLDGMDEETMRSKRPGRVPTEEQEMLDEVNTYGRLLNLEQAVAIGSSGGEGVEAAAIMITADNFDANSLDKRPVAWKVVRNLRVLAREPFTPDNRFWTDESTAAKIEAEEKLMLAEVAKHGRIIWYGGGADPDESVEPQWESADISPESSIWIEERMKRVIIREQVDRSNGMDEESIASHRPLVIYEVDSDLRGELDQFGKFLIDEAAVAQSEPRRQSMVGRPAAVAGLLVDAENYDPKMLSKRPEGWSQLRIKRVMLKEHIDRLNGVDEETLLTMRGDREIEEEITMMDEVETLDKVLNLADLADSDTSHVLSITPTQDNFSMFDPSLRPEGWDSIKKKRVQFRNHLDRLAGVDEATIEAKQAERLEEEESRMMGEVATAGKVSASVAGLSQDGPSSGGGLVFIDAATFDPAALESRPSGWGEARRKRITKKEQLDRLRGVKEDDIVAKRVEREAEEEQNMVSEVVKHGHLIGIGGQPKVVSPKTFTEEELIVESFDADSTTRPTGWADIRLKRVYIKEWQDRKEGLDESVIMGRRYQREQEAEKEMVQEVTVRGRIRAYENVVKQKQNNKGGKQVKPFNSTALGEGRKSGSERLSSARGSNVRMSTARLSGVGGPPINTRVSVVSRPKESTEPTLQLDSFIFAANQTLNALAQKVAEVDSRLESGSSKPSIPECVLCGTNQSCAMCLRKYGSTTAEEEEVEEARQSMPQRPSEMVMSASMRPSPLSSPAGKSNRSIGSPPAASPKERTNARAPGPLKSDLRDLVNILTEDNFDAANPEKRPQGWVNVQLKRVEDMERVERQNGVGEKEITFRRAQRLKDVSFCMESCFYVVVQILYCFTHFSFAFVLYRLISA